MRNPDGTPKGCAFVKFSTRSAAIAAIEALHEKCTMDVRSKNEGELRGGGGGVRSKSNGELVEGGGGDVRSKSEGESRERGAVGGR